jgi:hypothetical protein
MIQNWTRMLLAVLLGNLIYFAAEPFLSEAVRHSIYQFDGGLILDFVICAGIYLLLRTGATNDRHR